VHPRPPPLDPAPLEPPPPSPASPSPALLHGLPARLLRPALRVSAALAAVGGQTYLVGGAVRDLLLQNTVNDADLEVHGLEPAAVEAALAPLGHCKAVGRSFGVFKLRIGEETLDIALPRAERRAGAAAAGVQVVGDPWIGIEAGLRRRDLTINAMAIALPSGALCDPTGGQADLQAGLLRPADAEGFGDDPLRVLRAARFGARFGFAASPELEAVAARVPLGGLPPARVWGELRQILLGPRPALGLRLLAQLGALDCALPALARAPRPALLETAARLPAALAAVSGEGEALAVALAALHPAGDPSSAAATLDHLELHAWAGAPLRAQVMAAVALLGAPPEAWAPAALDTTLRRAAEGLSLRLALLSAEAQTGALFWSVCRDRAQALGVIDAPLPPLLSGRALVKLGVAPGPPLGRALADLREAQLQGAITTEAEARAWFAANRPPPPLG
jgi:tRNA nucleotidyltransferase (CCA-adding enzyme)